MGGWAQHLFGEAVHPLLDLDLVFVEVQRELGHNAKLLIGNKIVYCSVTSRQFGSIGIARSAAAIVSNTRLAPFV